MPSENLPKHHPISNATVLKKKKTKQQHKFSNAIILAHPPNE
ncbi:hypothetical protein HMPREF1990_00779 [Porphyromonas gingivalis W4087]|nr:hypothetical protein HMPREF1990_00779 [Porphyromonas gingivalis W4087]